MSLPNTDSISIRSILEHFLITAKETVSGEPDPKAMDRAEAQLLQLLESKAIKAIDDVELGNPVIAKEKAFKYKTRKALRQALNELREIE
jgi:hypothetical protein